MLKHAIGIIESVGLTTAVTTADAMLKAANVELIGYEITKGLGLVTVKVAGDVGAVKAALEAGEAVARAIGTFRNKLLIARPADGIELITQQTERMSSEEKPVTEEPAAGEPTTEEPATEESTAEEPATEESALEQQQGDKAPAEEHTKEAVPTQVVKENDLPVAVAERNERKEVCNICNDPRCTRKKGESRSMCINHGRLKA